MNRTNSSVTLPFFETALAILAFAILAAFTYAKLSILPYTGFVFASTSGEIRLVFDETSSETSLKKDDVLAQVGQTHYEDYKNDLWMTLFDQVAAGDVVPITVQRDGVNMKIPWTIPGWTQAEFLDRFNSVLVLAYILWSAGILTIILVRPKDLRRLLVSTFFFTTSLWIASGSLSAWHIWGSAVLLRVVIWLWIPLTLHLHWVFPRPFRGLPASASITSYAIGAILAILQVLQFLPPNTYYLGFIAGVLGSLILMIIHFILQREIRRNIGFLAGATAIALLPSVALSISALGGSIPASLFYGYLALPILPGGYFLVAFRRRLGDMELRVNRVISTYVFIILLSMVALLMVTLGKSWVDFPSEEGFFYTLSITLVGMVAALSYPTFTRFFERRFLGLPLPPTQLSEIYSERITTSLNWKNLRSLIQDELLTSLLVREAALLRTDNNKLEPVVLLGIEPGQLPEIDDLAELTDRARVYLPQNDQEPFPWVRLILPLNVAGKLRGLWLLGRRDPDDYYAPGEIDVLKSIANQTSIALVNIEQAEHLRALYQSNVERHEQERINLARDLHDDVLNELAAFTMRADLGMETDIGAGIQEVNVHLRKAIAGLRPALLRHGLAPALEQLASDLSDFDENSVDIQIEITSSDARYDPMIETHLYRIVQQACENALRHAQANSIRIFGKCTTDEVKFTVNDDGIGFSDVKNLDFNLLLSEKHYGIAGMFERAEIIRAELQIDSEPGVGTTVEITWQPSKPVN